MRKDVKTGLLIGTVLCLAATVWFCIHQQVLDQPRIEDVLSQKQHLFLHQETENKIILTDGPDVPEENEPSVRMHTVLQGETLSDISKMYYGTVTGWGKIYEANQKQLSKGPNALRAGMQLAIPFD
ncbi:MAG: LysM domain/BON superfamily protein [Planctomycetes bacterium ADurb.Bin401]|nr:MAG: LysM domain/BON superfamily protein [Planctomycetes bacterium ADurb.Bin401]